MKITFICAVFPPEPEPAGVMARQLAESLTRDGHSVNVIVPVPNRPGGRVYQGFSWFGHGFKATPAGYRLFRCPHWLVGEKRSFLNRIMENITFGISAMWAAWRAGRPDVLIIETWPLIAVECAAALARWWRVPYVYYMQDVYPEAALSAGYAKPGGILSSLLRRWDGRLCRQSGKVVAISDDMAELLKAGRHLSDSQIKVIRNWQDAAEFAAQDGPMNWRAEQEVPADRFVAMFAGTLGHVSGADILIDVAEKLRANRDILILCIGEGVYKEKMQADARARALDNIRILPFQPRERLVEVQRSADVMLLTMQKNAGNSSVPSKLVSYMAAGRPVICAAEKNTSVSCVVEESGSGVVVPSGDAVAIAEAVIELSRNRVKAAEMGHRSRYYFERNLTLSRAHQQFAELLAELTGTKQEKISCYEAQSIHGLSQKRAE